MAALAGPAALAGAAAPGNAPTTAPAAAGLAKAFIDGTGHGWRPLGKEDFTNVNCHEDTWTWDGDSVKCTGQPVGVIRSVKPYKNLELVCQWRHLRHAGNSGLFFWTTRESLDALQGPGLPQGIEAQVLDLGYTEAYEKQTGKPANWFTCHGDVFPTQNSKMTAFPPASGSRSFPSKHLSRGLNEWNHYYIRAINGEIRLWVNGEEVSGGTDCQPAEGYLCLESEGSPVEYKGLRLRELP